ncbi:MAG: hypothetical protein HZA50_11105 [Planctomycetes bacterium]|nr:hypothetical protein [Planctomycetota bacterium]
MGKIFDIRKYGASADGKTICTAAIQRAIDACHEAGGGRVLCESGTFLTGTLVLKSNVELDVAAGCRIVGSTSLDDYSDFSAVGFRTQNAPEGNVKSLIRAAGARNIAITGDGEINGSGPAFYDTSDSTLWGRFYHKPQYQRPLMIMLYDCDNVRFEGTSFIDSPCWTFWLMKCRRVNIHRVRVAGDQKMINNDGIDIDSCRDVAVSDSVFKTGDDCLILRSIRNMFDEPAACENVTVSNCTLDSWCQGVRVGCPGDGEIRNCTFSNLVINSQNNGILFDNPRRYVPPDGLTTADVHDILFSNVVVNCANMPIGMIVEDGIALKRLSDIAFSNFRIRSGGPCVVQGSPETIIQNVSFDNISIETSGQDAVVCRHCRDMKKNNVELSNQPGAV